jgi:CHAD domain-containing protein
VKRLPPTHLFLARQMRDLSTRLGATLPRVRKRADDEAIHDMRVALRRLRVVLKIARPIFGRFHVDAIRASFTRVHRASGALRDEEVLRETLADLHVASAELDAWMARRAAREELLHGIVQERLRAGDLRNPMRMLRALLVLPVAPKRRRTLVSFAHKVASRAQADVQKRRDANPEDALALHELRIAYKGLRYTTEIFRDALPLDISALAHSAERFQKRLGEIHDLDVARVVISRARNIDDVKARVLHAIALARVAKVELYMQEMRPSPRARAPLRIARR